MVTFKLLVVDLFLAVRVSYIILQFNFFGTGQGSVFLGAIFGYECDHFAYFQVYDIQGFSQILVFSDF